MLNSCFCLHFDGKFTRMSEAGAFANFYPSGICQLVNCFHSSHHDAHLSHRVKLKKSLARKLLMPRAKRS